jgi:hypothetical protein
MQLQDFAQVVRSKNAGPRRFTLDVIFRSDADSLLSQPWLPVNHNALNE